MYKDQKLYDRREMLRVKIKSLAEEARIIRREEQRAAGWELRTELHLHRVGVVRSATRDALMAYGLIRGRTPEQTEPRAKTEPNWDAVDKMLKKYGPPGMTREGLSTPA